MSPEAGSIFTEAPKGQPVPPVRHPDGVLYFPQTLFFQQHTERLQHFASGELIRPSHYEITTEMIDPDSLRRRVNADGLFEGFRSLGDTLPPTSYGLGLEVNSYNNNVRHKDHHAPHIRLRVICDPTTGNMELYMGRFSSWIQLGIKNFILTYGNRGKITQSGIAELEDVTRMYASDIAGLYTRGKSLIPMDIEKLGLSQKGFPEKVDWVKTFRMYTNRLVPDAHGEFSSNSQPLTAEAIYRQSLIEAK